jgi:hypothetical protein
MLRPITLEQRIKAAEEEATVHARTVARLVLMGRQDDAQAHARLFDRADQEHHRLVVEARRV